MRFFLVVREENFLDLQPLTQLFINPVWASTGMRSQYIQA